MATFKEAENGLLGVAKAGAAVAGVLAGAVVVGGLAAAASMVKLGIAYQDQMNTLQAVSGATAAQMKMMGDRAIELGNDLSLPNTSAAGAATAMLELVKAGLSVNDAMAAAKGTLQLATAATIAEGDAATYVAQALNTWHMPGTDAVKVADMLAASANASAGSIVEMGYGMQEAGGQFAGAKIPLDELLTVLGELSNGGIRGSMAGAQLKQAMLNLITPTTKQKEIFKELNLHLYDSHGKMVPLRSIIDQLATSTGKLTQKVRDYDLGQLFGSQMGTMEILLNNGVAGFDAMKAAVDRSGAAADVANAKSKGLGGALRGLNSQWETLQLTVFQKVSPSLEAFIRTVSEKIMPALQTLTDTTLPKLLPALDDLGKAFAAHAFTEGLAVFVETMVGGDKGNQIAKTIWDIDAGVKTLAPYVAIVVGAWIAWNVALAVTAALNVVTLIAGLASGLIFLITQVGFMTTAQWLLNVAMDANPIGLVVIAIALLAAGFVLAYQNIKPFRDFINGLWEDVKRLVNYINNNWDTISKGSSAQKGAGQTGRGPNAPPPRVLSGGGGPQIVVTGGMTDDRIVAAIEALHASIQQRGLSTSAYAR